MNRKFRKIFQILVYYVTPITLLVFSFITKDSHFFAELGNYSLYLLSAILFVKPIAAISKINFFWDIVSYRRELGILTFWLFLFHSAGLVYLYKFYEPSAWSNLSGSIYWGLVGGLGMTILAITANNYAVRLLRRNWKRLHYLAYFVLLTAFIHTALIRDEYVLFTVVFAIFFVLKVIEFSKLKKPAKE